MKKFTKLLGIVLIIALVMSMGIMAFADESSSHVITITNTDQNVSHKYEAYQIFKGKLDESQTKLADIVWGNGVNAAGLITALKGTTDTKLATVKAAVASVDTTNADAVAAAARTVAEAISSFQSTNGVNDSAGAIDAFASLVAANLGTKAADFAADPNDTTGKTYNATVTGDGYYFVKDVTTALTDETTKGSDTLSKYLLAVVKDTTIVAKDTGITPDKEILGENNTTVKADSAAVGDTVTFQVKIKVPNTKKYVDHFIFDMVDTLPKGLTFTGITSVKVGTAAVSYDLYINDGDDKVTDFTAPTDPVDAGAPVDAAKAPANTKIKLVFTDFKAAAEAGNWIGQDMVITYTAVVNKNADFTSTGNKNEVYFDYSNDPNHDYDGDQPQGDDVVGQTPKDQTTTKLINIEINKTDGSAALAGAEFEITSEDYTTTLVTGEKFVASNYTAQAGETIQEGTYYKLKDGSYTETAPTDLTTTSYDSTETTYKKVTFSQIVTTPGTAKKVTVISGEDGKIRLEGLNAGTYTIKETKAPTGFNLDETEHKIKVDWNATTKAFAIDASASDSNASFTESTATASITIVNQSGATLPSTGGIGTTIFYVVGSIMVVAAGVLLITKKRMSREG